MSEPFGVGILGLGSFFPPQLRENSYWKDKIKRHDDEVKRQDLLAIERTATGGESRLPPEIRDAMAAMAHDPYRGARLRHVIDDEAEVSDMEAEACRRAMRDAQVRPDEIDLLIVYSMVPDRLQPSNAPAVAAKCELVNATAWSLDVGCATFQPQLLTSAALINSGVYRKILVVLSSAATRILDYSLPMSMGFGDGAAAAVIGKVPADHGLLGHFIKTDGSLRDAVVFAPIVGGEPQRRWDRVTGPTRFATFNLDHGKQSGVRSTEFCVDATLNALKNAGVGIDDVSFFLGNQSVGWLVDACRRALGLPAEKAFDTFPEVANIGGAAVVYNLERLYRAQRLKDGDIMVMYSPGAGFTRAAIVYKWHARH
jgi:3-oxoacyl-[acyl-carrier-protein] synthase-3